MNLLLITKGLLILMLIAILLGAAALICKEKPLEAVALVLLTMLFTTLAI